MQEGLKVEDSIFIIGSFLFLFSSSFSYVLLGVLLTHSLTHSFTHSLTHSLSPSLSLSLSCMGMADLTKAAEEIGYPVMIKSSEGGGGKGIRKARNAEEFPSLFHQVQTEVQGSPIFVMQLARKLVYMYTCACTCN